MFLLPWFDLNSYKHGQPFNAHQHSLVPCHCLWYFIVWVAFDKLCRVTTQMNSFIRSHCPDCKIYNRKLLFCSFSNNVNIVSLPYYKELCTWFIFITVIVKMVIDSGHEFIEHHFETSWSNNITICTCIRERSYKFKIFIYLIIYLFHNASTSTSWSAMQLQKHMYTDIYFVYKFVKYYRFESQNSRVIINNMNKIVYRWSTYYTGLGKKFNVFISF